MSGVNRPLSTQRRTVAVLTPKRAATSLVVIYTEFLFMGSSLPRRASGVKH